jgi:hypothetical protein
MLYLTIFLVTIRKGLEEFEQGQGIPIEQAFQNSELRTQNSELRTQN